MQYKLQDDGLYCLSSDRWLRIGGWIQVLARTRLTDKRHGHGALLEWLNFDGVMLREVVYARDLNSDNARQIRDMLVDTGYPLTPGQSSWSRLQHFLIEQMALAAPATVVNRTGWHGPIFATSNWTVGTADEPHHFVGQLSSSTLLEEAGDLRDWQNHVGKLCSGNPLAIFCVGTGLAAPLLAPAGMENGAFHFVGASSAGKTTLLQIAASLYGSDSYRRSWISTSNGLAAVSSEHNDMLLTLDEIGMARPEDVDTAIYQIMNGSGKLRANVSGELAATSQWRTLVLSSGEVWIAELLQQIGKPLRAGQQIRLVEIPIFGIHGAFDELHGRKSAQQFVDELKMSCQCFHGTVIREWLSLLTGQHDELSRYLSYEIGRLSNAWTSDSMASQVQRVVRRFARLVLHYASLVEISSCRGLRKSHSMLYIKSFVRGSLIVGTLRIPKSLGCLGHWKKRCATGNAISVKLIRIQVRECQVTAVHWMDANCGLSTKLISCKNLSFPPTICEKWKSCCNAIAW